VAGACECGEFIAEYLLASQKGLCSMELVIFFHVPTSLSFLFRLR
jgi:hypothetical protein